MPAERETGGMDMSHKLSRVGAACCALALSVGAAKADTITTFNLSATFVSSGVGSCPGCKLRGHIVINTTTGALAPVTFVQKNIPMYRLTCRAVGKILLFGRGTAGPDLSFGRRGQRPD
jgi:hypothetical protein